MKTELEYNLAKEFAFMRSEPAPSDGINAFGIDTGDGWYPLLYNMCKEMAEVLEMAEKSVQIVVDQIKEKYGSLNVYYHLEREDLGRDDLHQKISDIVEKYEDMSNKVCETCGCEGTLRTDLIWIQTLCDSCYSKCVEKFKKKQRDNYAMGRKKNDQQTR